MLKKTAGQPKKADKDLKKIHNVRFTDSEWKRVGENATNAGLKISDFIRQRSLIK